MGKEISSEEQALFAKLQQFIKQGDETTIKAALAEGFKVNSKNQFGETLLMVAAEAGKLNIIELLIMAKAKLDTRDQFNFHDGGGKTALHRAVANRHIKVVEVLLAAGAKIDVADKGGRPPLVLAIQNKDLEMAELLLKAGANPNGSGKDLTPLSDAVALKSAELVELLLKYGADPNHPADERDPVLGTAALWDMVESCCLLLKAGAKVNAKDSGGRTAFEIINKPVDPTVWKRLTTEQAEKLRHALQRREEIKAMLLEAAKKQTDFSPNEVKT